MFKFRMILVIAAFGSIEAGDLSAQQFERDKLPAGMIFRLRHDGDANYALLSPDAKLLAIANGTKHAIWDLEAGKTLWTAKMGEPIGPRCAVFSPDGKHIAVGGDFALLRMFDVRTGKEVFPLKPIDAPSSWWALAASPDGKHLVSASTQGTLAFWDLKTGKLRHQAPSATSSMMIHLDFAPDSKKLAVSSRATSKIHFWDPDIGKPVGSIHEPRGPERATFSPDRRSLGYLQPNLDSSMRLWNIATAKDSDRFGGPRDGRNVNSFAFSPDGRTIVLQQGNDSKVYLIEVATGLERARFVGHHERVYITEFASHGRSLLTCAADKTVILWDVTGAWQDGKYRADKLDAQELNGLWGTLGQPESARMPTARSGGWH